MANLIELSQWENGIYQLETIDPVQGGPEGIDNLQAKQLANRTKYLKSIVDSLGANKQPLDATLTAIAALVTAADKLVYATGVDTFATTTLTAFARTLLDDVDAATMRATLGAAPLASPGLTGTPTAPTAVAGTNTTQLATTAFVAAAVAALVDASPTTLDTLNELAAALGDDPNFAATITTALGNKQPLDATLTAIAALVTAADKLVYATGVDTFATTTLTAFARTLLDDVDAATMRTTLGLGDVATKTVSVDFGSSLAGNGYQKLPSGLIIQWGLWTGSITGLSYTSISYPISFPNGVFYTNAAIQAVGVNNQIAEKLITIEGLPYGLSRFLLTNTDGDSPIQILRWFSIGY